MSTLSRSLLRDFGLRSTPAREDVLTVFLERDYALAYGDIERAIRGDLDRVTVYRTLKTFLDRGLVHKVLDDAGVLKFALCSDACTEATHRHDHVHFKCSVCEQTSCLEVDVPEIRLPTGYTVRETNLLIQGICQNCQDEK